MELERAHQIARERGPVMPVYWVVRAILQPFFHIYFRLRRIGLEHIPKEGPVLLASNHRSFSDPFLIGCCLGRPLHFVAKIELFDKRWKAWILLALGAFPIRRGESDEAAMETARVILERGGAVGIFPEGTRVRPGPLGEPKRGVGRLALETGAPIVPDRDPGHRGHPPRLAHPPAPRDGPLRPRAALPAPARPRAAPGRRAGDLEPRVVVHLAAVGVARRPAADPPRRRGRRRQLGNRGRRRCWPAPAQRSSSAAARRSRPASSASTARTPPTCPASSSPRTSTS